MGHVKESGAVLEKILIEGFLVDWQLCSDRCRKYRSTEENKWERGWLEEARRSLRSQCEMMTA